MLCSMLADTTYWNFLDIRMMEAMAIASMIPAARESIENFKKTFYNMSLKEAAPYFPVIPVKEDYTTMHEDLDKDPSQMTINELHNHRFYLETEILKTGPDTCAICKIKIESVTITWQIHIDDAYQACMSIEKKNSELKSQAIKHISVFQAELLEARLPVSIRGENLENTGPIRSFSQLKESQSHPLPKGYEWTFLCLDDVDNITKLYDSHPSISMPKKYLQWIVSHPQFKRGFLLGIKDSLLNELKLFIYCVPLNISIGGKLVPMVFLIQEFEWSITENSDLSIKLWIAGCKEAMRILERVGIFQAFMPLLVAMIFKPVVTVRNWRYSFEDSVLPYSSPRTVGLRKITSKDIPKALALINQYALQFEVAQIFQNEEEFSHRFLCSSIPDYITTYVVEDPVSGDITDMFSFRVAALAPLLIAEVTAVVVTKSPAKQLITDLLVCLKQQKFNKASFSSNVVEKLQLHDILHTVTKKAYFLLYNYQYPEVDEHNFCIFDSYC